MRETDTQPQDMGTPDHNHPTEKIDLEPDDLLPVVIRSSMAKTRPCIPAEKGIHFAKMCISKDYGVPVIIPSDISFGYFIWLLTSNFRDL